MEENFRDKFIEENLEKASNKNNLTDWEQQFVEDMEDKIEAGLELTQKQFNILKEIADK